MNDNVTFSKLLLGISLSSLLGIAALAGIAWQRIGELEDDLESIVSQIDHVKSRIDEIKDAISDTRRRGY